MGKLKSNEKGYGAFDTILIILVIILVGAVGYLAGHQNSTKTNNSSSNSAKLTSTIKKTADSRKTNASDNASYFNFKELSVKFVPDKSLTGLTYSLVSDTAANSIGVYVTDSAVQSAFNQCQSDAGSSAIPSSSTDESSAFIALTRVPGTFNAGQEEESTLVKQFDGFHLDINYPNGDNCASQSQTDMSNWQQVTTSAASTFVKSLKATVVQD